MPFSPSDFAWWVWLLFGAGAWLVFAISMVTFEDAKGLKIPCGVLAAIAALAGVLSGLIGIIRFVKWVWGG